MTVGEPGTYASPWFVYLRVAEVLRARCALTVPEAILEDRTTPAPLLHESARLRPGKLVPMGRAAPGGPLTVRQPVDVVLSHAYDPNAKGASYAAASRSLVRVIGVLLSGARVSGILQPKLVSATCVLRGQFIEQVVAFTWQYNLEIPATE